MCISSRVQQSPFVFSENVFPIVHFLLVTSTSSLKVTFKVSLWEHKTLRKPKLKVSRGVYCLYTCFSPLIALSSNPFVELSRLVAPSGQAPSLSLASYPEGHTMVHIVGALRFLGFPGKPFVLGLLGGRGWEADLRSWVGTLNFHVDSFWLGLVTMANNSSEKATLRHEIFVCCSTKS